MSIFTSSAARALKALYEEIDSPVVAPHFEGPVFLRYMGGEWPQDVAPEQPKVCAPKCVCGVQFTGGAHSDWCEVKNDE